MMSYMVNTSWRRHDKDKTVEELETDLEELKADTDKKHDYAYKDRRAYCLANRLEGYECAVIELETELKALAGVSDKHKETPNWEVTRALVASRLVASRAIIDTSKAELATLLQDLKDYDFGERRKPIDENIEEIKKELEAKKNGEGDAPPPEGQEGEEKPEEETEH